MSLENMNEDQVKDLAALADKLANDPKTRTTFLRMTKALAPNTVIPELDIEDKVAAFAKPHIEKVASLEAKLTLADAKENVRNARAAAKKELNQLRRSSVTGENLLKSLLQIYDQHRLKDTATQRNLEMEEGSAPQIICSEAFVL
mgnify:CR=1 FL=1